MKVELGQFPQAKVLRRNDWGWAISNGNVVCCSWAQGCEDIVLVLSQCVQRSVILRHFSWIKLASYPFQQIILGQNSPNPQKRSKSPNPPRSGVKKKTPTVSTFFLSRPQVSIRFFGSRRFGATWCSGSSSTAFLFRTLVIVERFPDKIWIGDFS